MTGERILTRAVLDRAIRRASRTSGGAIQASGSRFVRCRWASVLASTASFLTRAEKIALVARGWAMCSEIPASVRRSANQPQP